MGRISGPLMDRFDLRVEVPAVSLPDLDLPRHAGAPSAEIAGAYRRGARAAGRRASPISARPLG